MTWASLREDGALGYFISDGGANWSSHGCIPKVEVFIDQMWGVRKISQELLIAKLESSFGKRILAM